MELSITAILKEEAKSKLTEKNRRGWGKNAEMVTEYYIGYTRVSIQQGVVQAEIPLEGPISEEIMPFILAFEARCQIDERILGWKRLRGKYTLPEEESAETKETTCTVNIYYKEVDNVHFFGSSREKIIKLFELLRDGKILPYEEFGGPQLGKSRKQLEEELAHTQGLIRTTKSNIDALKQFVDELIKMKSPFIRPGYAVRRISQAINAK